MKQKPYNLRTRSQVNLPPRSTSSYCIKLLCFRGSVLWISKSSIKLWNFALHLKKKGGGSYCLLSIKGVYSGGTDRPGELCYNFSISNYLTQIVNFPTRIPDCGSHSPTLLDFFLSSDASICSTMAFPPLGNSDHVVVSVSIDFLVNSKQDAPFHRVAYDYSRADWDGLRDHLRDVPWEDIFKLGASTAAS